MKKYNGAIFNLTALFMVYLVISLTLMNDVSASTQVSLSTGDLSLEIPLMEIPGVNGQNYPIKLAYTGGDGIRVDQEASWVGLGWTLDTGAIRRSVVGTPDDMKADATGKNVYMFFDSEFEDKTPWWEKVLEIIPLILVMVVVLVITWGIGQAIIGAFSIEAGTFGAFIVSGVTYTVSDALMSGKVDWSNFAIGFFSGVAKTIEVTKAALDIYGAYGVATGLSAVVGYIQGSTFDLDGPVTTPQSQDGFLYSPSFQEHYSGSNAMVHDGGQPDYWSISGSPASGKIIIAHENVGNTISICTGTPTVTCSDYETTYGECENAPAVCGKNCDRQYVQPANTYIEVCSCELVRDCEDLTNAQCSNVQGCSLTEGRQQGRFSGINEASFYLQTTPGKDNAKIEFFTNLANCDYLPSEAQDTCSNYDEEIDQFAVTTSDGTKYIYGDPGIKGSIVRVHASGSSSKYHKKTSDYESKVDFKNIILQHYPYAWKLVAILSPDYVDGSLNPDSIPSPDYNPLNSESSNKGSWIAFRYDMKYDFSDPTNNCGYNFGSPWNGQLEQIQGDWKGVSGGYKDVSYLKEIITPTHKAVFETSERLDGKESDPWSDVRANPWNYVWYGGNCDGYDSADSCNLRSGCSWQCTDFDIERGPTVCTKEECLLMDEGSFDNNGFCEGTSKDHLYKLDRITLRSRIDNQPINTIVFNKNVDYIDRYELKPRTPGGEPFSEAVYTLKKISSCDASGTNCLKPTTFEYQNNMEYDRDKVDAFGMYYADGNQDEHASPTSRQNKFGARSGFDRPYAWTLKKATWPTGATTEWDYEIDTWFTSRGDVEQPYISMDCASLSNDINACREAIVCEPDYDEYAGYIGCVSTGEVDPVSGPKSNYYAFLRNDNACESNYGGGLRVKRQKDCDLVDSSNGNKCFFKEYIYDMEDNNLACTRTSGSMDGVPLLLGKTREYEQDLRRKSHIAGPQTISSVLYNQVTVKYGRSEEGTSAPIFDGGSQTYYYLTTDSNPENTNGAIDVSAQDEFSGTSNLDYDKAGSEAQVSRLWSRGQEYKVQTYDNNGNLLEELRRYYTANEHFKWYFGDFDSSNPNYNRDAFGVSSGWTNLDRVELRSSGATTADDSVFRTGNIFDASTGLPTQIREENFDKDKITEIEYASSKYPEMLSKNMLVQPSKQVIYASLINGANVKSSTLTTYRDLGDNRWLPYQTKEWVKDVNNDGILQEDEISLLKTSVEEYDDYGNIIREKVPGTDTTIYNSYSSDYKGAWPTSGWNDVYGSSLNPNWVKTYSNSGLLESVTDENGQTTSYEYDSFNRLKKEAKPGDTLFNPSVEYGYHQSTGYNDPNYVKRIIKIADGEYAEVIMFTDGLGNLIQTQTKKDTAGNYIVKSTKYDGSGRKIREYKAIEANTNGAYTTNYGSIYTEFTYYDDPTGRVKQKIFPDGSFIEYTYGSNNGRPTIAVKDENNQVTIYTYDLMGNLISAEQGGAVFNYEYDVLGNLVRIIDPYGRIIEQKYDGAGRLLQGQHPDIGLTELFYDKAIGNPTRKSDDKGQVTLYEYDALNRIKKIVYG